MSTKETTRREFIMPTAINMLSVAHENIVDNLRRRQNANIDFPSLYRLAFMVHHVPGELLVTRGVATEEEKT